MTVDEAIGMVREGLNIQTDDSSVSDRYIFTMLKAIRSTLIRQESNKAYLWSGACAQYHSGIEMEISTISEIKEYQADLKIYRSKDELPELVDTKYGKIILGIYFDNGIKVEYVEFADYMATSRRRYKLPGSLCAFIRNNRLCLIGYNDEAGEITMGMEGIFTEPEVINDESGYDYIGDIEFNIPSYLEARIFELTVQAVGRKYGFPIDTKNNGREEIQQLQSQN